jgi:hypothetical protein
MMSAMQGSGDGRIKPRVSVVMPVYNSGRANLEESIGSFLAQTLEEIELICVNDASTDTSEEVLREFESKDDRICVISLPRNRGTLEARTIGFLKASGDYVVPLDPDDFLYPDACRCLCGEMDVNGWVTAQFGVRIFPGDASSEGEWGDSAERLFSPEKPSECSCGAFALDLFVNRRRSWGMGGKVFRREELVSAVRSIPSGYCVNGEDGLVLLALLESIDGRVGIIKEKLYNYRWGRGISTTKAFSATRMDNMIRSAVFACRFLNSRPSRCAESYARMLARNIVAEIVYRARPESFRKSAMISLSEGIPIQLLDRAFEDLNVSYAFLRRCAMAMKMMFARKHKRRLRLRRRLALARRIAMLARLMHSAVGPKRTMQNII